MLIIRILLSSKIRRSLRSVGQSLRVRVQTRGVERSRRLKTSSRNPLIASLVFKLPAPLTAVMFAKLDDISSLVFQIEPTRQAQASYPGFFGNEITVLR